MSKLAVLFQFSEMYVPYAGIAISTLLKNNQDIDELHVFLATRNLSEENRGKLEKLENEYHRKFVYLNADKIYDKINEYGCKDWNGSQATWMKLFVMSEIPSSIDRLLYLDSDTLITGSLKELGEMDLEEHPIAAVIDSISPKSSERLKLEGRPYHNGGLLLFNLQYWREHDTESKMLQHLKENIQNYPVNDQDLINDFFRDGILTLNPKFNFQGTHFFYRDKTYFSTIRWKPGLYYSPETIAEARKDIRVIHFFRFCGEYPWQPGNIHPCNKAFEEEKSISLWKDYQEPAHTLKPIFRIEKLLYKTLPKKLFFRIALMFSM